jgi:protein-disulfide isomerase
MKKYSSYEEGSLFEGFSKKQLFTFFTAIFALILISALILFNIFSDSYSFEEDFVREDNITVGDESSEVKVIYFTDFECSACKTFHSTFNQVKEEYKGEVLFVYKHYPLPSIHPYAVASAESVQAANLQDKEKALEYIDLIFKNQAELSVDNLEKWAGQVGLDVNQLKTDRGSKEVKEIVSFDKKDLNESKLPSSERMPDGKSAGDLAGTPTIIITKNDEVVDWWSGGETFEEFSIKLDGYVQR